jgi:glutathione S-transferase
LRLVSLTKAEVYPTQLWEAVRKDAPNVAKWAEAVAAHPSVRAIYNEEAVVEGTRKRIEKIRAQS